MDKTQHLGLPYIAASQAQKHVTHNEALERLDALVQMAVLDRDLTEPPSSPATGSRYIIAAGATGLWSGKTGQIAHWTDGFWDFLVPQAGWSCWLVDENNLAFYNGSGWQLLTSKFIPASIGQLGVNAGADSYNRLIVASAASLFTNEGAGHQLKLNKSQMGDTASLLYQTGYSGRAEMGLTGDDDFHIKVSGNGASWHDALVVNRNTGAVTFPNTVLGRVTSVAGRTGAVTLSAADIAGLGTAAVKNAGSAAGNLVTLDASGRLPALDGSQVSNLSAVNFPNGAVIDRAYAEYTVNADLTAVFRYNDTVPLNTDGTQILMVSLTPKSVTNRLRVRSQMVGHVSGAGSYAVAAVFVNAETTARRSVIGNAAGLITGMFLEFEFVPASLTPQTIALRVGPVSSSNPMRLNGATSGRLLGGSIASTLIVEEIKA